MTNEKADPQYPDFEQSFIFEDPKPSQDLDTSPVYPDPFYKDPEFVALEKIVQSEEYCGGPLPQDWGLDDQDDDLKALIENLQAIQ